MLHLHHSHSHFITTITLPFKTSTTESPFIHLHLQNHLSYPLPQSHHTKNNKMHLIIFTIYATQVTSTKPSTSFNQISTTSFPLLTLNLNNIFPSYFNYADTTKTSKSEEKSTTSFPRHHISKTTSFSSPALSPCIPSVTLPMILVSFLMHRGKRICSSGTRFSVVT